MANYGEGFLRFLEKNIDLFDDLDAVNAAWNAEEWNYWDIQNALQFFQNELGETLLEALDANLVKHLYGMFEGTNIQTLNYPSDLEVIPRRAFCKCKDLTTVTIGNGIRQIQENAFWGSGIESVDIPGSVESIGVSAFANCSKLNSVTIAPGVKRILNCAFGFCKSLKEIVVPDGCDLHMAAFKMSGLQKVTLPKTLEEIPEETFQDSELKEVVIPDGVVTIGDMAFLNSNISTLEIPQSVKYLGKWIIGNMSSGKPGMTKQHKLKIRGLSKDEAKKFFEQNIRTPSVAYHNLYLRKII